MLRGAMGMLSVVFGPSFLILGIVVGLNLLDLDF